MSTFTPLPGMHLTIRLNPVAMVEHLDDAVALQAARRMSSRTYIGYVDCLRDFPLPVKPYHKCSIQFVGQGLPTRLKDEFVERDMCVPIYPNTLHPLAREPLRARPPFPFPDCYQYSFVNATVRVPNQDFDPKLAFWLSGKHVSEHHRLLSHDLYRRAVLKREKGVPGPDPASIILWERHQLEGPPQISPVDLQHRTRRMATRRTTQLLRRPPSVDQKQHHPSLTTSYPPLAIPLPHLMQGTLCHFLVNSVGPLTSIILSLSTFSTGQITLLTMSQNCQ